MTITIPGHLYRSLRVVVTFASTFVIIFMASSALAASTAAAANTGTDHAATSSGSVQALASEVNDPTAPLPLVQFRNLFAPSVPDADGTAYLLEIQPVLPVAKSDRIPFDQLIKITLPVERVPDPDGATGLGDFQMFDLIAIKESWGRWGFGAAVILPTATDDALGQGKWQLGPAAAIMYTAVKNLQAGAVFQNPASIAGESSRADVNAMSITPTLTYNFRSGWFLGHSDFDFVFDWKQDGEATIPLGIQVGKVFSIGKDHFSFSAEAAYSVARPDAFPRWLFGFELNWILPKHDQPAR